MPKLSVYNISGQATGEEIELNDLVFGVEFNEAVVHQAIVMHRLLNVKALLLPKPAVWFAAAVVNRGDKKAPAALAAVLPVLRFG